MSNDARERYSRSVMADGIVPTADGPSGVLRGLATLRQATRLAEGGIEPDLFDGRLAATGTVYRIRRTNVPEADGQGFYRQIGEGRSHGVEIDVNGRVARGLGVQARYAWTDTADI